MPRRELGRTQRRILETIELLRVRLHRDPISADVAAEIHYNRGNLTRAIGRLRELGYVAAMPEWIAYHAVPLRLTVPARRMLDLPITAYLAWSIGEPGMSAAHGREAVFVAIAHGIAPLTPFSDHSACGARDLVMHAAIAMARAADVVVVIADRTLLGRADVATAIKAHAPVYLIERARWSRLAYRDPGVELLDAADLVRHALPKHPVTHRR